MPSALELIEGQVFAGQFRVVKPLAQGGMGAVYVVEQISTGKKRALKLMLPSAAVVDGTRRFEQEARAISSLNRPGNGVCFLIGRIDRHHARSAQAYEPGVLFPLLAFNFYGCTIQKSRGLRR